MSGIRVEGMGEEHLERVAAVLGRQEAWWKREDGRLREPREVEGVVGELEGMVSYHTDQSPAAFP